MNLKKEERKEFQNVNQEEEQIFFIESYFEGCLRLQSLTKTKTSPKESIAGQTCKYQPQL